MRKACLLIGGGAFSAQQDFRFAFNEASGSGSTASS